MSDYADSMKIITKHQETMPVHVVDLAYELGLKVFSVEGWNDKQSGMIQREPDGSYHIYVNGDHHKTRRRFTIAHELAHWILHRDIIGDGITEDALYRSGLPNVVEVEANGLAADILMPLAKVRKYQDDSDYDVSDIAKIFNVSKQAMAIRLGVPN